MNEPPPSTEKAAAPKGAQSATSQTSQATGGPKSMRSRRTANWARSSISDDGYGRFVSSIKKNYFIVLISCVVWTNYWI